MGVSQNSPDHPEGELPKPHRVLEFRGLRFRLEGFRSLGFRVEVQIPEMLLNPLVLRNPDVTLCVCWGGGGRTLRSGNRVRRYVLEFRAHQCTIQAPTPLMIYAPGLRLRNLN